MISILLLISGDNGLDIAGFADGDYFTLPLNAAAVVLPVRRGGLHR